MLEKVQLLYDILECSLTALATAVLTPCVWTLYGPALGSNDEVKPPEMTQSRTQAGQWQEELEHINAGDRWSSYLGDEGEGDEGGDLRLEPGRNLIFPALVLHREAALLLDSFIHPIPTVPDP